MQKRILVYLFLLSIVFSSTNKLFSQNNLWHTYRMLQSTQYVTITKNKVFAISNGTLYSVNKSSEKDKDAKVWSRSDGLSEVDISNIEYSAYNNTLVIYYKSGNIDLLYDNGISNINAIALTANITNKNISRIIDYGNMGCFICGDIGLVDLDISRALIMGVYFPNISISSIAMYRESREIALVKDNQVLVGNIDTNLQDPSLWEIPPSLSGKKVKSIGVINQFMAVLLSDDTILWIDKNKDIVSNSILDALTPKNVNSIEDYPWGMVMNLNKSIRIIKDDLSYKDVKLKGSGDIDINKDVSIVAEALGYNGFQLTNILDGSIISSFNMDFNTPLTNNIYKIRYQNGILMAVNGGRAGNNFYQKGVISILEGDKWYNIYGKEIDSKINSTFYDPVDIIRNDIDGEKYFFVATWGDGIIQLDRDFSFKNHYTGKNSSLTSAVVGNEHYYRTSSFAIDRQGNLWLSMGGARGSGSLPIASLSKEGEWQSYDISPIKNSNALGDMLALSNGVKYILDFFLQEKGEGFTIFQTRGLEYSKSDYSQHFSKVQEANGKVVNFTKINCMALDNDGALWMGSDIGFFIISNPLSLPASGALPIVSRPVSGEKPPYYRVLDNINITSIVVDNINQKWMGTQKDGVYLLSSDGTKVLSHYDMSNSPIVSNSISSLAIDNDNGILYIGTNQGLNTLYIGANTIRMNNKDNAIVYPNPLRPDDPDMITIGNLSTGSVIKILNSAGLLVHQGISNSSVYKWIPRDNYGYRLSSGIYTIVIYSNSGGQRKVIKLGIISN